MNDEAKNSNLFAPWSIYITLMLGSPSLHGNKYLTTPHTRT